MDTNKWYEERMINSASYDEVKKDGRKQQIKL